MITMQQPCRTPWLLLSGRIKRGWSLSARCTAGNHREISSRPRSGDGGDGDDGGMRVYDSLSSSYRRPLPRDRTDDVRGTAWYVCGPTVYDSAHLGHGRTYVSLDILRRLALSEHSRGEGGRRRPRPLYAMNVTDVDDKIIRRSVEKAAGIGGGGDGDGGNDGRKGAEADPLSLARHFEREFWEDMDALNVMRPDVVCRVSEHVEETIVPYVRRIVDGGMAYVMPEHGGVDDGIVDDDGGDGDERPRGSVYFDVRAFESATGGRTKYGKLAPDAASTEFFSWESNDDGIGDGEGERIRRKRDPRDFCLWKHRPRSSPEAAAVAEPLSASYASPWGPGRPGWHVECSAMIRRLSEDFASTHDFGLHAGGADLKFPHHCNEIAQAEAHAAAGDGTGSNGEFQEWIPHWVHTGHLYVKGRKMSKSLKNFVTIREMLGEGVTDNGDAWSSPADDFRLWVLGLSGTYRGPATYGEERMEEARAIRRKLVRFMMEGEERLGRWRGAHDVRGDDSTMRLWGEEELELFRVVNKCSTDCHHALMDDLDGSSFVEELIRIADAGLAYIQTTNAAGRNDNHPQESRAEEPLRFVLDTFRGQLDLVGFSRRTVDAGISARRQQLGGVPSSTDALMLDEVVAFRAAVRSAALGAVRKEKDGTDAAKGILDLCDELRDDAFPSLGVEILDGKVAGPDAAGDRGADRGWRRCPPRERASKTK